MAKRIRVKGHIYQLVEAATPMEIYVVAHSEHFGKGSDPDAGVYHVTFYEAEAQRRAKAAGPGFEVYTFTHDRTQD